MRTIRTAKKRDALIAALAEGLSVRGACHVAGLGKTAFYSWVKDDPDLAAEIEAATDDGTDFLEDVARMRAIESSDTLLIFLLKSRRPEKYRETSRHEHTGANGGVLTVVIGDRTDGPQ